MPKMKHFALTLIAILAAQLCLWSCGGESATSGSVEVTYDTLPPPDYTEPEPDTALAVPAEPPQEQAPTTTVIITPV